MTEYSVAAIVPVLNEARGIAAFLDAVRTHDFTQVILVDGGSNDATRDIIQSYCDRSGDTRITLAESAPGRARQMNAGAKRTHADILLFLHADTHLPTGALAALRAALGKGKLWGRFDVCLDGRHVLLPMIAWLMNWRSRLTGICTGDQAIFVRRAVFDRIGGYADIALMEDIEIARRLKRVQPPACINLPVTTSARRWQVHGVLRTILRMGWLRLKYALGASPAKLARQYTNVREP